MDKCHMCEKNLDEYDAVIPVRSIEHPGNKLLLCSKKCWDTYQLLKKRDTYGG